MKNEGLCLLIGNSRWHWARQDKKGWSYLHSEPNLEDLEASQAYLRFWTAVGAIPKEIILPQNKYLKLSQIPVHKMPDWLGIDRALGCLGAINRASKNHKQFKGIIIADAGTAISITRLNEKLEFNGGLLAAGLNLQLIAMENGTKTLNNPGTEKFPDDDFPFLTSDAMREGVLKSLTGLILYTQKKEKLPIFICGGDSEILFERLSREDVEIFHYPNLVLEGMVAICENKFKNESLELFDQP